MAGCAAGDAAAPMTAAVAPGLGAAERDRAIALAEADQPGGRVVAVTSHPDPTRRIAVVLRYDPVVDLTRRAFIDVARGEVLRRDDLKAYPTPLHPEEIEQALALARRAVPAVETAFRAPGGPPRHDWVNVVHGAGPRFGHRLVVLRFHHRELPASVLVDLTAGTAVRDDN